MEEGRDRMTVFYLNFFAIKVRSLENSTLVTAGVISDSHVVEQ